MKNDRFLRKILKNSPNMILHPPTKIYHRHILQPSPKYLHYVLPAWSMDKEDFFYSTTVWHDLLLARLISNLPLGFIEIRFNFDASKANNLGFFVQHETFPNLKIFPAILRCQILFMLVNIRNHTYHHIPLSICFT